MRITLRVKKGSKKAHDLNLKSGAAIIGRMRGCDVRIPPALVSREHCELRIKGESVLVEDLGSANGTIVNGKTIKKRMELEDGDLLQVGPIVFEVCFQSDANEHHPAPEEPEEIEVAEVDETDETDEHEAQADQGTSEATEEWDAVEIDESTDVHEAAPPEEEESPPLAKPAKPRPPLAKPVAAKDAGKKRKPRRGPAKPGAADKDAAEDDSAEETPDASSILDANKGWNAPSERDFRDIFRQIE
jgi:pSer/pThr/pTyr-binding forkhead associated (FHA) protein